MRADVKLGIVVAAVLVVSVWGFFKYRDGQEPTIPLGPGDALVVDATARPASPMNTDSLTGAGSPSVPEVGDARHGSDPVAELSPVTLRGKPADQTDAPSDGTATSMGESRRVAAGQPAEPSSPANVRAATSGRALPVLTPLPSPNRTAATRDRASRTRAGSNPVKERSALRPRVRQAAGNAAVEFHRVREGDTFTSLAQVYYGSERYTQFLIDQNPKVSAPDQLRIGTRIRIPARPAEAVAGRGSRQPVAATSVSATRRTYRVQQGDSLYKIARDVLGDADRWRELYTLNRTTIGADPGTLQIGTTLILPSASTTAAP